MLGRMREHAKALSITLWLVIFALIGTTFFVWGFRSTSGGLGPDTVATVEGEKVPYTEYQQAYQRQYQQYQQALGDKFDEKILDRLNLKTQIVESLVLRYVPGARVVAVAGDEVNLKITTRIDLVLADRMLQMRTVARTGDPGPSPSLAGSRFYRPSWSKS